MTRSFPLSLISQRIDSLWIPQPGRISVHRPLMANLEGKIRGCKDERTKDQSKRKIRIHIHRSVGGTGGEALVLPGRGAQFQTKPYGDLPPRWDL